MMLRKALFSALALGMLASVPAMAEDATEGKSAGAPGMERQHPHDTDGDGLLTRAEFDAAQDKRFAEMDADSDGKISKEEMKSHRDAKRAEFKERRGERKEKREERRSDDASVAE